MRARGNFAAPHMISAATKPQHHEGGRRGATKIAAMRLS